MLTMRDIAAHVGVSVSTVSLVLSDRDAGRVSREIADRIRSVAAELGYVPNQLARSLKTKQSHTIGLIAHEVATVPFGGHMIAGAQQAAWDEGYLLLLIDVAGFDEMLGPAIHSLLQRNVESLIFAAEYHRDVEIPLLPRSTPAVILDGRPVGPGAPADFVVPDELGGARGAVDHLLAAGHRRIGYLTAEASYPVAGALRRRGYEDALRAAGIHVDPSLVEHTQHDASTADGYAPALRLLDRPDRPTAVFCFGDQLAMSVYLAAARLGLRIPDDLSVVGFDNQQFVADALIPGLTSAQLPHSEMGGWAVRRAIQRIRGELDDVPPQGGLIPCPLVERHSVAPLRSR